MSTQDTPERSARQAYRFGSGCDSIAIVQGPSRDRDGAELLGHLRMGAFADPELDELARYVCERLRVPAVWVALADADGHVLPGQSGLSAATAERRRLSMPTAYARMVASGRPLVLQDVRRDAALRAELGELGAVAFGGVPLLGDGGRVIGACCVLDHRPRDFDAAELSLLSRAAREAATLLQLRSARQDAQTERQRADELHGELEMALRRSELLLKASDTLIGANNVTELRERIAELVAGDLRPSRIELVITDQPSAQTESEDRQDPGPGEHRTVQPGQWNQFDRSGPLPVARAARERTLICHDDLRPDADREVDDTVRRHYLADGLVSMACVPVIDAVGDVLAVLEFAWEHPRDMDVSERAVLTTIAGYVGSALQRVRRLQRRISIARDLQLAMLTDIPALPGLRAAARYVPATLGEYVGGDWYDAFALTGSPGRVAVAIGDVAGHDMRAAAVMGQLRAMLRQACWQRATDGPALVLTDLDEATDALDIAATSTAILAFVQPSDDEADAWTLTWSNAGHPPPIVVHPDRRVTIPEEHDPLLGYPRLLSGTRTEQRMSLAAGSTVLLYTDGLVEHPATDLDGAIRLLAEHAAATATGDPHSLADSVLSTVHGGKNLDDIAVLAVYLP